VHTLERATPLRASHPSNPSPAVAVAVAVAMACRTALPRRSVLALGLLATLALLHLTQPVAAAAGDAAADAADTADPTYFTEEHGAMVPITAAEKEAGGLDLEPVWTAALPAEWGQKVTTEAEAGTEAGDTAAAAFDVTAFNAVDQVLLMIVDEDAVLEAAAADIDGVAYAVTNAVTDAVTDAGADADEFVVYPDADEVEVGEELAAVLEELELKELEVELEQAYAADEKRYPAYYVDVSTEDMQAVADELEFFPTYYGDEIVLTEEPVTVTTVTTTTTTTTESVETVTLTQSVDDNEGTIYYAVGGDDSAFDAAAAATVAMLSAGNGQSSGLEFAEELQLLEELDQAATVGSHDSARHVSSCVPVNFRSTVILCLMTRRAF